MSGYAYDFKPFLLPEPDEGAARRCDKCGGLAVPVPYVGGDCDPTHECDSCGKHFGCWWCDRER